MKIDILYFEGCPNAPAAFDDVREMVRELGLDAEVREIEVKTDEEAVRLRFLGSPTVRVDGVDIEPAARGRSDFSFTCRLYGNSGAIPKDLIRSFLRSVRRT